MTPLTILVPTGHLSTSPFELDSFQRGLDEKPDLLIADAGSADMGPYPLGADRSASNEAFQYHDLEHMLLAARRLAIPMIVGSASDAGTDRGVASFVQMIRDIASEHHLAPFSLATISAELSVDDLHHRLASGEQILGLNGRDDLDEETLEATDRVVAVMGAEPIQQALAAGADVVVAGRACDAALFAAPLINAGHDPADAYLCGKTMECASFCAEPFMGKESVLGRVDGTGVYLTPMHPDQRCTPASVASHTMYERRTPFRETVPGGYLDLSDCLYEQVTPRTTRVTGQRWVPADTLTVKIEGSGKVAERAIFILGINDPYTIEHLDDAITWARGKLTERFGQPDDYDVYYHTYGRGAVSTVLGDLPPTSAHLPGEVGVVVEVAAPTVERADLICEYAARSLFYARLPNVKGTGGTAAIMSDEVLRARPAYRWTINHLVTCTRQDEMFRTEHVTIDGRADTEVA